MNTTFAEFQNVNPEGVIGWIYHLDDNSKSFILCLCRTHTRSVIQSSELLVQINSDKDAILCNDIHAKILMLRYFQREIILKAGDLCPIVVFLGESFIIGSFMGVVL